MQENTWFKPGFFVPDQHISETRGGQSTNTGAAARRSGGSVGVRDEAQAVL